MCGKWCNNSTLRIFERAEISILLPFDSLGLEGKMFFTIVMGNEMLTGLGWIWDDLGVCVAPQRESLLRTGSTCPCQNMHRDIIPCNSLLGQKGVEKSCWLESWMLSMAFHNAVWLISMVKIRQLFPSYTGTTKATTWQTEWAVMAVNCVQSHWSSWIILSPNLRAVCKRLQRTLLGQLAMCISDATTRLCEFWTCGSFNSASIWLIGICKEVFFATAIWNEINLYNNKCVEASFSSMRARYFGRSLVFLEWVNSFATPLLR